MHRVRAHISSTAGHDDPVPFARRPQQAIPIWLRLVHQTRVRGFYRAQEGEGREHWAPAAPEGGRSCLSERVWRAVLAHARAASLHGPSLFTHHVGVKPL